MKLLFLRTISIMYQSARKMGEKGGVTTFVLLLLLLLSLNLLFSSMVSSDIIPDTTQNNPLLAIYDILENLLTLPILDPLVCDIFNTTPLNTTICSAIDLVAENMHLAPQAIFNITLQNCGLSNTQPFPCN